MSNSRRHAILIAASEFPAESSLPTLRCPKNDVLGMSSALTSPESGLFKETLPLVNLPHHETLRAINRIFHHAKQQDQILIYYSGHGKRDKSGTLHLTATDTESTALETSSIPISTLLRLIENYDCKQVALILDCCFSGAVGHEFKSGVDDQLQLASQTRGVYIMTASTANQTAKEKAGDQYSLFTKHILQGINLGEADYDNDGLVSMDDLYEYVSVRVPLEGAQQPKKWTLDAQGGKLIIARAAALYSAERLKAFKEIVLGIEDEIDDDVFHNSIRVIKQNQPKRDKQFFQLLDKLLAGELRPGKFSSQWYKLAFGTQAESGQLVEVTKPAPKLTAEAHQQPAKTAPQTQSPAKAPEAVIAKTTNTAANGFTDDLNGVKLEMVYVPGGMFKMGTPKGSGHDDERPQHDVAVPAFYIGKFQVTQAQWKAVMGKNPSSFKGDELPVETVSWNEAKDFCQKIQKLTKKAYRLPSEAEWEYACRAGTTGDYAGKLDEMGWYGDNSGKSRIDSLKLWNDDSAKYVERLTKNGNQTHPVGQKNPNAFGLYDMHGNVWEWCEDVWHGDYKNAPADGSAWLSGEDSTSSRVVRGGSWSLNRADCRSAYRYADLEPGFHYYFIGFRVVVSART